MPDQSSLEPTPSAALLRFEKLVARAMMARDPAAAFDEACEDPELTPELRAVMAGADRAGVRISALLVARLRFERLIRGSTRWSDWFASDPKTFTDSFRRYHHSVAPRALHPQSEAEEFERWLEQVGLPSAS